jgi:hypothetical protein
MIIFYSKGFMCNGLFQYSFLKSIAKSNEKIYCIDSLMHGMNDVQKGFDLNDPNFHIYLPGRAIDLIFRFILFPIIYWLAKVRLFNYFKLFKDDEGKYKIPVNKKTGLIPINIVQSDFFQSEELFDKDKLHFKVKDVYFQEANKIFKSLPADRIKVFVHIRRGDYLSLAWNGVRGVNLPLSYFNTAMDLIKKKVECPYYIFLSDDPEFLEQAFQNISEKDKYISKNSAIVDLSLMSFCKYGVCSNSTFAWWGAYLINKKQYIVFPKYWLGWKTKVESHPGIQPSWSNIIDVE